MKYSQQLLMLLGVVILAIVSLTFSENTTSVSDTKQTDDVLIVDVSSTDNPIEPIDVDNDIERKKKSEVSAASQVSKLEQANSVEYIEETTAIAPIEPTPDNWDMPATGLHAEQVNLAVVTADCDGCIILDDDSNALAVGEFANEINLPVMTATECEDCIELPESSLGSETLEEDGY